MTITKSRYNGLWEKENTLIYVNGINEDGFIVFDYCDDPTQQPQLISEKELLEWTKIA